MFRYVKTLLRETVSRTPVLKDRYIEWEFLRRKNSYRGIYASFADAAAHATSHTLVGYNHDAAVETDETKLEHLHPADYSILYWIGPLLAGTRAVFDLGGHVGQAFYAYRRYLTLPKTLRWIVCDLPASIKGGEEFARKKGETQLLFTEDRDLANEANVFFTSGALQYIEEPLGAILEKLRRKPVHVLVNRVPLGDMPQFITLQNNGDWVVPYKIANRLEFIRGVLALGYELVDSWTIARSVQVLGSPGHLAENYYGMYFRLKNVDV